MNELISTIGQGLIWGLLALGLYLTMRILNFPDMTVEGSFPFGASVSAVVLVHTQSVILSMLAGFLAGMLAGMITGLLTTKGKIPSLLAGILVMTALYSVNLKVMGRANLSLLNQKTIVSGLNELVPGMPAYSTVIVGLIAITVAVIVLGYGLYTEKGQAFIATGDNEKMARSLGISIDAYQVGGLMISNGLVGLCGAMVAQNNGYVDINMGIGVIVIGLASIIIGELVFGELSLRQRLVAIVVGSVLYRMLLLLVLKLGFNTDDLKLVSAIILAICLMLPRLNAHTLKIPLRRGQKS